MSDEISIPFEDEDDSGAVGRPVEVALEDAPDPLGGRKAEELLAELKAKEAEMAALKAQADQTAALTGAFGAFGERLEKTLKTQATATPAPVLTPAPGETIEAFRERIKNEFLVDPFKAVVEIGEKVYGPALSNLARATTSQSKELVMLQPEKRAIYEKYAHEVEALANRPEMLGNPRAYQEAVERVSAAHMNEIVEDRISSLVEQRVKEALEKQGLGVGAAQTASAAPRAPYVETAAPKASGAPGAGRVVKLNAQQMAVYKSYIAQGIDKEQAADIAQMA